MKDFSGVLQTDGYAAYNGLRLKGHILQLACMAHARRNFEKALDNDSQRAETALLLIGKLYQIERMAKENHLNHDEIKILRQQQAQPVA
ncbi:MAG: transposase [Bacteroidetes bacterium]|nr:transposase [Bacteroidota bacterium]